MGNRCRIEDGVGVRAASEVGDGLGMGLGLLGLQLAVNMCIGLGVVTGIIFLRFFRIRLGHHSLNAIYESGQQMFQGIKAIPHPGYSHPSHSNDLMLIKLNRRIRETQGVKPISIASQCPTAGTSCLVSGWGTTSISFPKVLQCLNITVLSDDRCRKAYPEQIDETMFCAGDESGRDSCQGDSGGPVVCNGSLQGLGLVSFGQAQCGQPYVPGVYTNLCRFTKWIQDTIRSNS
uniref:Kallikrein related peptidase 5 n=1 Tax=Equus asinus asinus TaxID=83772 RepID=A0A8C4LQ07_EQUAS